MPEFGPNHKKTKYIATLGGLFDQYNKILLVGCNHVGSHHMQKIRISLRGHGVLIMGKNTMVRKVVRAKMSSNPKLEALLPHLKGNVGLLFTDETLPEIKELVLANRVPAAAKAGVIAPVDVIVPAGDTGMEPTQTAFLQALNIQTKIFKGQIQILNDVELITKGDKVNASQAALLGKLNIRPFSYGLSIQTCYDNGNVFDPALLDLTPEQILGNLKTVASQIACISLAAQYPTTPAVPHYLAHGFKNLLALSLATEYSFEAAENFKNASASAAAAPAAGGAAEEEAKPAAVEEESSSEEMGMGMFGGDDDW